MSDSTPTTRASHTIVDIGFLVAMAALAAAAAWPIYASLSFVVMAAAAITVSIATVLVARARRWSHWIVTAIIAGFFLVAGVPLAVPSALVGIPEAVAGLGQLVTGIVGGWKELVTISIPVGSYRATLVPAFMVFLVGVTVASTLALRSRSLHVIAVPVLMAVQGFGLVFGSSQASAPAQWGPLDIAAPREVLISILSFGTSVAWLIWRSWRARSAALSAAQNASGVRNLSHGRASAARRGALAAGMVVVSVAAATAVTPALAAGQTRDVLRSAVDPTLTVRTELSPLSTYRDYFSDDAYDATIFTVDGGDGMSRVRLATLSSFDGQAFRVGEATTSSDPASSFARVPYTLSPSTSGEMVEATISISDYSAVWVPTVGELVSVAFEGERPQALADSFFYNQELAAGIELAAGGLREGDTYTLTARVPAQTPLVDLAPLAEGPSEADAELIPDSLVDWVEQQDVPPTAAGLQQLIDRLRARGLLSHSLDLGSEDAQHRWITELEPYTFAPSLSGHSTGRIGTLFGALVDKEAEVGGTDDSLLIAAVGDDEQFAVAAALLARQFGFDSRVVIGTRLSTDEDALSVCESGVCDGSDISAWIEVRGADDRWATVDVTPQHTSAVSPDVNLQRDPQVPTEVATITAETVTPAQGLPGDGERTDDDPETEPLDLGWLWTTLRIIGTVLLVLVVVAGPVLVIVAAKWLRRRGRRSIDDPTQRITAGWEEYLDTSVDFGLPATLNITRTELAARHQSDNGAILADVADRAVFGGEPLSHAESDEFWRLVDAERSRLSEGLTLRQRIRALVSLRSFTHRVDVRALVQSVRPGRPIRERNA